MESTSKTVKTVKAPRKKIDSVKVKKYAFKYTVSLVRWIFIIGMCFVVLYPLFKQVALSVMDAEDLYDATVNYLPKHFTMDNYKQAWNKLGGMQTFMNSVLLTVSSSLLIVISSTLVGYGLARFKFKLNGLIFGIVILALVVPADLFFTPRYMMFSQMNLIDTPVPILCFAATSTGLKCSLYIFLMRQFFKGQPHELEEAAYVDGAGPMKTFIKIMLPGAVSMMVTVFLFSFVWQWLDSSYTSIFMRDVSLISTKYTGLNYLWAQSATSSASNELTVDLMKNAGIIIIIAPLVVLYAFTQKFFVESISRSGLVG